MISIDFDDAMTAALVRLEQALPDVTRPAAQAGAQVLYDEVKARVPVHTGTLAAAIYQAYSPEESQDGVQQYHVSWNKRKAPHGHLVEFGTSRAPAHPFLRPAYDAASAAALQAAEQTLHQKLSETAHV